MIQRLAVLLGLGPGRIRFRSVLNGKIFSLILDINTYELVELEGDTPQPFVIRELYRGEDTNQVKSVIWKELNNVQ